MLHAVVVEPVVKSVRVDLHDLPLNRKAAQDFPVGEPRFSLHAKSAEKALRALTRLFSGGKEHFFDMFRRILPALLLGRQRLFLCLRRLGLRIFPETVVATPKGFPKFFPLVVT